MSPHVRRSALNKIWLITGVSRGLGKELARAVVAQGDVVVGTSRNGRCDLQAAPGRLEVLPMELSSAVQIKTVVDFVIAKFGRIDVLVNNAGFGLLAAIEEASEEELANVYDTNLFGTLRVVRAALPAFRAQKNGHIINISSIAAMAPGAGAGLYASAKAGMEAFSESLFLELAPLGVRVSIVEPGAFRTEFLSDESLRKSQRCIEDYAASAGVNRDNLTNMGARRDQIGDPVQGAQAIIKLSQAEHPPLRLLLGSDALRRTRGKLKKLTEEMDAWQAVTLSTDYPAYSS
jgi:NAD(P)-dependent dehydrogenase (short-subunit alcohol dehydrogenase family)